MNETKVCFITYKYKWPLYNIIFMFRTTQYLIISIHINIYLKKKIIKHKL